MLYLLLVVTEGVVQEQGHGFHQSQKAVEYVGLQLRLTSVEKKFAYKVSGRPQN